ncbi:acyl-CoA N-acyltransferase [Xylariomycetidae sp. FL2044]|nr:acyl-CoA N-acyltransferase [Xylariomycetidae sp. FL2044]
MPLELHPATEADAKRCVDIEKVAYGQNPWNDILFPGEPPAGAVEGRAAGLIKELQEDETTRWYKVVDPEMADEGNERMIAFAKWHVFTDKPKAFAPRSFGPHCNAKACEMVFGNLANLRVRNSGEQPCVYLSLLHTDPKQQGRGAGRMLVDRCVEDAKKLGLPACLESSLAAHPLYLKCGFRDVEYVATDLSEWGATEMHPIWSMKWDP